MDRKRVAAAAAPLVLTSVVGWVARADSGVLPQPARSTPQLLHVGEAYADYSTGVIGQVSSYYYDSNLPTIINNFVPLLPEQKRVGSIHLIVSGRTGSYGSGYLVSFEVRDFAGNLQRTVSESPIDLESVPQLTWVSVSLSPAPLNRTIGTGEYLAAHVYPAGSPGGTLQLRGHFQASVR
jgi:hypothetical protein